MGDWKLCLAFLLVAISYSGATCPGETPDRNLICYQNKLTEEELDPCLCTHWVLSRDLLDEKDYLLEKNEDLQIILSVETGETNITQKLFNQNLQGIEFSTLWKKEPKLLVKYLKSIVNDLHDHVRVKRSSSVETTTEGDDDYFTDVTKSDVEILKSTTIVDSTTTVSSKKISDEDELYEEESNERKNRGDVDQKPTIILRLPSDAMFLAKHYDLKGLSKYVDLFVLNTDNIVESKKNVTYHPSRLMGINDIHNADSLVDLITGLGIPKEKLILGFPSNAYKFQLSNSTVNLPQSPALNSPKLLTQTQLCKTMKDGKWTIERDEDLTAPYAFKNDTWIAFDDDMSASIKSKYIALSNLAGAAIMNVEDLDWSNKCSDKGASILKSVHETFTVVTRKPRQTQLLELEELLHEHSMDSPTRVVRVVDHDGATHVVRRDVVVNFQCSRQGYFVHPSGCNRFYRCVKFNQYTDDFTVFEYDCPAGLAFDERWEVCVWPGSLPDGGACQGSSEIAPVPRNRFECPKQPGYYADPENCRWFFACLDHVGDGYTPLTAYEFRCPFSLVFNEQTLVCDWPWNVQGCGKQGVGGARFTYGDLLEGRLKPSYATIPDYLVSGGRVENANAGGSILDNYYTSNGILEINDPSESQENSYGSTYSSAASKFGAPYSGEKGSYVSGSNQYGQVAGDLNEGAYVPGAYPSDSGDDGQYRTPYVHGKYPGDTGDGSYKDGKYGGGQYSGNNVGGGAYVHRNYPGDSGVGGGAYVHGKYPGDNGGDGAYRDGVYSNGQYIGGSSFGGAYIRGKYPGDSGVGGGAYVHGKYPGDSGENGAYKDGVYSNGQYLGGSSSGGAYIDGKYPGDSGDGAYKAGQYVNSGYIKSNGQYESGKYKGEQYSGSGESGASVTNGPGRYYGAAASYNSPAAPVPTLKYSGESGQYDASKYSNEQYFNPGYTASGGLVSSTISPFLSTQAGQYSLSNGALYSGPAAKATFAAEKSVLNHVAASQGQGIYSTPSTIYSTASTISAGSSATPKYGGLVSSTTPVYSSGPLFSGVSLSGEKFGVDGESGHIPFPIDSKVYTGFENGNYNGFDSLSFGGVHPSLSPNVFQSGYSTSGKAFFSPTPASGGFSSYSPVSFSTPAPTTYYQSTTSSPLSYSPVSSTPSPIQYSSYSSAQPAAYTTASPIPVSYSTPKPASYAPYSPTLAPYSPSASYVSSYSPTPAPYSPSASYVSSYSPTPAPYSPSASFVSSYSPQPIAYSTTPRPYTPSSTVAPAVVSYSTPAPKSYYATSTPVPLVQYSTTLTPQALNAFSSGQYNSYSSAPVASYPQSYSSGYIGSLAAGQSGQIYSGPVVGQNYLSGGYREYSVSAGAYNAGANSYSGNSYKSTGNGAKYSSASPVAYSTEKGSYASSTSAPVAYSSKALPSQSFEYSTPKPISYEAGRINTYSSVAPSAYPRPSDYANNKFVARFDVGNAGINSKASYSGEEYLPPVESAASYEIVKKPCEHSVSAQPYVGAINYQSPSYVYDTSSPVPSYNAESLVVNPIVVQPLSDQSFFKDYFYSSVLPSSYSTPAPFAYSSTPAYFSYSTPVKSYVSSTTPAPHDFQYVSSYSTPKPVSYTPTIVSTTGAPIVSTYTTPKPYSYSPTVVSTTASPYVDSYVSSYSTPKPVPYSPTFASTTASPISYTTASPLPVSYYSGFESSKVYQPSTPAPIVPYSPSSYASYSAPPVVYGPSQLQPIKSYQSTGTYDVQSYTATPKPCESNVLHIEENGSAVSKASSHPDGTYVVGIKKDDKVVIVSRLSDFNPLLVEKLGATCDCHSVSQPIKVVRRRKVKSSTAGYDKESSGSNVNSIHSYNAYEVENHNVSPNVDIVSYNTQEEAEKSQSYNQPKQSHKKLFSSKKTTPTYSTTESSNHEEHNSDKLSITEFGTIECKRAGLFRHPKHCNKFYQCNWDEWKKKFALHEFKCPIHLAYDSNIGACNWPSKGPACSNDNLLV